MGGAASLIENGKSHSRAYWQKGNGGNFSSAQWYSTGPIIAVNNRSDREVIYLIMNTQPINAFKWEDAVKYLRENFISDIGKSGTNGDGKIQDAIVFDGASARQLWIRKRRQGVGPGYIPISERLVPHFICLWGNALQIKK